MVDLADTLIEKPSMMDRVRRMVKEGRGGLGI